MRARRMLVSVPALLASMAMVAGGSPAVAADEPDLAVDVRGKRAASGAQLHKAATADEGVIRRTVRLTDVQHATGTTPGQQLAAVDVVVDVVAQTVSTTATLNGTPAGTVSVVLGTWSGSTCTPVFGIGIAPGEANGLFLPDGEALAATASGQGNQVGATTAPHPRLRNTAFECAYANVAGGSPSTVWSVAPPEDLVETFQPVLEVEADDKVVGARKGKWARLSLEVRNTSRGAASAVRLTASGKGIDIRTSTIDVGPVGERSTEYLDLQVRLTQPKTKKGKKPKPLKARTLTLTVTDPAAATATAQAQVVVTPKPTVLKKLTGTYWWGWESTDLQSSAGWINHSVWFVDKKWAYTGWAEGKKPRCSAKVNECQRYSYNARTGTVRIGRQKAKVTSAGFAFKHPAYKDEKLELEPLTLPKKGARLGVDLYHQNWSGYCAISCTSYTDYLTMDTAGKFVEGGFSVGSWPGLGQSWSSAPADQRGTYKVVSTGIVEMTYADGTRKREVIGIQHDPSGKPNPAFEGVLIGDVNYYE
ncbi:type 1 fimbria pilin [Nocardioides cavernae]|uniref:Type 1 fimbria pilin n=1 Tax=Nocardioides cavernae TaxID=1921566 RepID=A0A7Y9GZ56_9ACTN|nr:hypothetical protein [Nocardioides cavernae]NYE35031.1 type 1 fimbria pilin [Nocardioides cavernae]